MMYFIGWDKIRLPVWGILVCVLYKTWNLTWRATTETALSEENFSDTEVKQRINSSHIWLLLPLSSFLFLWFAQIPLYSSLP